MGWRGRRRKEEEREERATRGKKEESGLTGECPLIVFGQNGCRFRCRKTTIILPPQSISRVDGGYILGLSIVATGIDLAFIFIYSWTVCSDYVLIPCICVHCVGDGNSLGATQPQPQPSPHHNNTATIAQELLCTTDPLIDMEQRTASPYSRNSRHFMWKLG